MNKVNEILLNLLDEIDSICEKNGLSYFLSGLAIRQAYETGNIEESLTTVEVLMPLNDIFVLQECIKDRPDRTLESIFTNKDFRFYFFKYVDNNTLYYKRVYDSSSHACGIHVRIRPLKQDPLTIESRRVSSMKRFWVKYHRMHPYSWRIKGKPMTRIKRRIVKTHINLFHDNYLDSMLKMIVHTQKNFSLHGVHYINFLRYNRGYDNRIYFENGMFEGYDHIELAGHKYRTVKDLESFMRIIEVADEANGAPAVMSTTIPFKEYEKYIESKGLSMDLSAVIARERLAKAEYRRKDRPATSAWRRMQRAVLKKKLGSVIRDIKDEVINYYENKNWVELGNVLTEYDMWSREYAPRGIALNFDDEVMDIYLNWLENRNENELAEKIRRNIELEDED